MIMKKKMKCPLSKNIIKYPILLKIYIQTDINVFYFYFAFEKVNVCFMLLNFGKFQYMVGSCWKMRNKNKTLFLLLMIVIQVRLNTELLNRINQVC